MHRTVAAAILAALIVAGAATSACGLIGGAGTKVVIPADYHTADPTYTLLYSTIGYESAATKRVLIRQNDTTVAASQGFAFAWRLVDAKGSEAAVGRAVYAGTGWGIPVWAADFSKVTKPGAYRLVVDAPSVKLATDAFPIGQFLMFQAAFKSIALGNAAARSAPIEQDNGFLDSNERSGTVSAHSDFLIGLLETFDRRRGALTEAQRTQTRAAIDRAVDYLLLLSNAGSGEFVGQSLARPYVEGGPEATVAGLRGLAHYAALAQDDAPEKADRALRRARLSEQWLNANAPDAYPSSMRAVVSYDIYVALGDDASLDRAAASLRDAVGAYDLRTMDRRSDDTLPHFEALYRMWRDLRQHPEHAFWEEVAGKAAAQYKDMIARNAFQVLPPGITDEEQGTDAAAQWDQVGTVPPPGDGPYGSIGNDWFLARAVDAVYLAQITGDVELEKAATASLAWVGGLNPGVQAERVVGGDVPLRLLAASFVTGLGGRSVAPWSSWEWRRTKPFATIVNGFRGGFVYDDTLGAGNTSLGHDGIWLYATAVYEDYLNPTKQAPQLGADTAPAADGVRLTIGAPSESGGVLNLAVTASAPGNAVVGAKVSVAWYGAALPDVPPDDVLRVTQCVTGDAGSCLVTLAADALPVRRPIMAAVTNVEDLRHPFDGANAPAPVAFP